MFLSRYVQPNDPPLPQRYFKEVVAWKRLNHPNVIPMYGAAPDIAELCVVSPWMPEGDLLQYLDRYPGANRVSIVRARVLHDASILNYFRQMVGVADGLSYLHSSDVIHGDLKGVSHIHNGAFVY